LLWDRPPPHRGHQRRLRHTVRRSLTGRSGTAQITSTATAR
jgi:hypothetical protein